MTNKIITLSTPHGEYELSIPSMNLTLKEFLIFNGIPNNATSSYKVSNTGESKLLCGMHKTLEEIYKEIENDSFVIRVDKDIDYAKIIAKNINLREINNYVAEYSFATKNIEDVSHVEFTQQKCRDFVDEKVKEFLLSLKNFQSDAKIVIGISGGGDSNTIVKMDYLDIIF